ncbi:MAG: ATP phosphoribosyltransferase regulatory subunit [Clostridia bacterium]|nr:ATP phosphoribosyltransferase regulatory subunit [Clostridia bacterium]
MSIAKSILRGDEQAALTLRALYRDHGYTQYKMNKFEEYDLYVRNKDFLISDHIITFTDTSGKLLALKPDVTLSIVKNSEKRAGTNKVYYQENVYRVSGRTHTFREIMQLGLECIGDVDAFCRFEVLTLAAKSLKAISPNAVLDVSHLGIVSAVLDSIGVTDATRQGLLRCIGEKNVHELRAIATSANVAPERLDALCALVSSYGKPAAVLPSLMPLLYPLAPANILSDFSALLTALESSPVGDIVRLDFSVIGNIGYYNGLVFKGFVDGVPDGLLSGGEYNGLMRKMGKSEDAIGFAVYLDALERFHKNDADVDVDAVVLYGEGTDLALLGRAMDDLVASGKTVAAHRAVPTGLRYRELLKFDEKEGTLIETDD